MMTRNTAGVRKLIDEMYTADQLNAFCFDYFPNAHAKFTSSQDKDAWIQVLLKYVDGRNMLDDLVQRVAYDKPWLFEKKKHLLIIDEKSSTGDAPIVIARALPLPLQKFDPFFEQWSQELARLDMAPQNYPRSVIAVLANVLGAELGFLLVNRGISWEPTVTIDDRAYRQIQTLLGDSRIRELLGQAMQHRTATYIGQQNDLVPTLFIPLLGEPNPSILVLTGIADALMLDSAIGLVIETILAVTENLRRVVSSEILELMVYHALRQKIGMVSDAMYNRQFALFARRLQRMTVYFEPIIYLHPTHPYIWGWEALARDPETLKAPVDLFQIAQVWGRRFQLELDMYFFRTAIITYVHERENGNGQQRNRRARPKTAAPAVPSALQRPLRARREELQPLHVNVYPETIVRTRYRETVEDLYYEGLMPLNKLTLELSEKSQLPLPEDPLQMQDPVRWFREYLFRLERYDVRFAIDDFGTGYASTSRLSRLGPACVKIDRDALLDKYGEYTFEYVLDFAQNVPGQMQVIIEGVDDESHFPLRALYERHIRYIQGHSVGMAQPDIDRLPQETYKRIIEELQVSGKSRGRRPRSRV
jgi:EAL domain-containing protein (putative c-di-GMP-specific phosphodiesterase class I)